MNAVYEIYPLPLFSFDIPKPKMTHFHGFGETAHSVCYIWLVKGEGYNILIDGGASKEILEERSKNVVEIQSVETALSNHRLTPSDINIVILTHLHHDHAAEAVKFGKATIIVQEDEVTFARHPHKIFKEAYPAKLFQNVNFKTIRGNREITKGIRTVFTPGHTPGTQSVAINTQKGTAIIAGFCSIAENFPSPTGINTLQQFIPPGINTNLIQAYDSMKKIIKMAAIIIPLHDPIFRGIEIVG